jgi:hypothetical protein
MPLKCLLGETAVFAFDFSGEKWEKLKAETRKLKHLSMPCCHAKATPKTSKLGTQFFAHSNAEGCETAPETAEHLLAKTSVAKAAKMAGWTVDTEVKGATPPGDSWVADVLATKGQGKIAIEIQWSKQTPEETKHRQAKYAESGVRGLWLMRHPNLLVEQENPTFLLRYDEGNRSFLVMIPSSRFIPELINNRNKDDAGYWQQEVGLSDFIIGALNGALKFAPAIGRQMPVSISTAPVECWSCKKETRVVHEVIFEASKILPGHADIHTDIYEFDGIDGGGAMLAVLFPSHLLRQHGIGAIKDRYSRTMGGTYLSNGCVHCDAIQGRFYDHDSWHDAEPTYTVKGELSKQVVSQWAQTDSGVEEDIFRWWFDDSALSITRFPANSALQQE